MKPQRFLSAEFRDPDGWFLLHARERDPAGGAAGHLEQRPLRIRHPPGTTAQPNLEFHA